MSIQDDIKVVLDWLDRPIAAEEAFGRILTERETLQQEKAELVEVLEIYAKKDNYEYGVLKGFIGQSLEDCCGDLARAALAKVRKE